MKNNKIRLMTITGIFTAIVFVLTAYLHVPSPNGYVHVGDGFIYLAATILPLPYAVTVGALGALLADCLTGYAIYAPASVVIKAATVFCFSRRSRKIVGVRNLIGLLPAWALCIGGYYLYDAVLSGSFLAPLEGIPGNIIQSLFSSVLFVVLGLALDKLNAKERILIGG